MHQEVLRFEKRFDKEIKEIIAVTNSSVGAGRGGKDTLWQASISALAYVDVQKNEVIKKDITLTWLMTDNERKTKEKVFDLEPEKIYRLKVRELLPQDAWHGSWQLMVVAVVERDYKDSRLQEILNQYKKPVVIQIDGCSELLLDKYLGMFSGESKWNGESCQVHLDVDEKGMETAEDATQTLLQLLSDSKSWDDKARAFAALELVELANEWQEEYDEEDDYEEEYESEEQVLEITKDEFLKRIHISEISVSTNGNFEFYYDDDNMFLGHVIIVSGNIKEGFEDAQIAG